MSHTRVCVRPRLSLRASLSTAQRRSIRYTGASPYATPNSTYSSPQQPLTAAVLATPPYPQTVVLPLPIIAPSAPSKPARIVPRPAATLSSSTAPPRAMAAKTTSSTAPTLPIQTPPFLTKLYQLVSDPTTQSLVSWTDENGLSFTVHKPSEFGRDILPKYFKHNNFSSFVRQLNQYGFHKQNPDKWMFGHDSFRRDRPDLLKNITRRRPKQSHNASVVLPNTLAQKAVVELGNYGLESELKSLRRDKDLLIKELVVTRQNEEQLKNHCENLETRVATLENSSKQMQAFIMHYFSQVLQPYSEAMVSRKRKRLPASSSADNPSSMIIEQPNNQIANISHAGGRSSVDALRVMMQQMGVGMARPPSNSQPPSSPRAHTQPQISFEPATVQELPHEENLSLTASMRAMQPNANNALAIVRPSILAAPLYSQRPPSPPTTQPAPPPNTPQRHMRNSSRQPVPLAPAPQPSSTPALLSSASASLPPSSMPFVASSPPKPVSSSQTQVTVTASKRPQAPSTTLTEPNVMPASSPPMMLTRTVGVPNVAHPGLITAPTPAPPMKSTSAVSVSAPATSQPVASRRPFRLTPAHPAASHGVRSNLTVSHPSGANQTQALSAGSRQAHHFLSSQPNTPLSFTGAAPPYVSVSEPQRQQGHIAPGEQPTAVCSGAQNAAFEAVNVQALDPTQTSCSPKFASAELPLCRPQHSVGAGAENNASAMMNGTITPILSSPTRMRRDSMVDNDDVHMTSVDGPSIGTAAHEKHAHDADVDRALDFLEDIATTPNTSLTMDAIESALREPRCRPNGTQLDTPDFDRAFDDKEFNIAFGSDDDVKLNGHVRSPSENERVIEDFLELSSDDARLPPPLSHLPEGTDIHALAKKMESFADGS